MGALWIYKDRLLIPPEILSGGYNASYWILHDRLGKWGRILQAEEKSCAKAEVIQWGCMGYWVLSQWIKDWATGNHSYRKGFIFKNRSNECTLCFLTAEYRIKRISCELGWPAFQFQLHPMTNFEILGSLSNPHNLSNPQFSHQ